MREFKFTYEGIEFPDYYQGCGTSFTRWQNVIVGIGDDIAEAAEDALNMYCQVDEPTDEEIALLESLKADFVKDNDGIKVPDDMQGTDENPESAWVHVALWSRPEGYGEGK